MGEAGGRDLRDRLNAAEWLLLLVLAAVQFTHNLDFVIIMPLGPELMSSLGISNTEAKRKHQRHRGARVQLGDDAVGSQVVSGGLARQD